MKTCFIYALCEPGTRKVRYIGKTSRPKTRLKQHLKSSVTFETCLGVWLRSLLGVPPNFVLLSEVPEVDGSAEEIRFIAAARNSLGMNLVNSTSGGQGCANPTPETRVKMGVARKGVPHTLETRAAMSAAKKGVPKSPEHRAAMRKPKSSECRAAMSAASKPPKRRAARSAAAKKLWATPCFREKMLASRIAGLAARRLAKLSKCPPVV